MTTNTVRRSAMRSRRVAAAVLVTVLALSASALAATDRRTVVHRRSSSTPSGARMPIGNLPGWRQVFRDDFNGSHLASRWFTYSGEPGGGAGGWWSPSHAVVADGMLKLKTYRDPAACTNAAICPSFNDEVSGVVQSRFAQTYGKYLIRVRTTPVPNVEFVALLWPDTPVWPPETDFAEEGGESHMRTIGATLHWAPNDQNAQNDVRANESRWHTLGVQWSPGKVVYTIDGRAWGSQVTPAVSSIPMRVAVQAQTDCQGQSCPAAWRDHEPDVDIDWVVAYAPSG
jgi:hypothetical protein